MTVPLSELIWVAKSTVKTVSAEIVTESIAVARVSPPLRVIRLLFTVKLASLTVGEVASS